MPFPRRTIQLEDTKMIGASSFTSGNATAVFLRMRFFKDLTGGIEGGPNAEDLDGNATNGTQVPIVVGAGIRTASMSQDLNVTQELSLGHFDVVETVTHGVASNTFTIDKMLLRYRPLAKIGVAPFGADVIRSPLLDAIVVDARLFANGINLTYSRIDGLHIQGNRHTYSVGSTVIEGCTFRFDRVGPFLDEEEELAPLMAQVQKFFPHIYQEFQSIQPQDYKPIV